MVDLCKVLECYVGFIKDDIKVIYELCNFKKVKLGVFFFDMMKLLSIVGDLVDFICDLL